MKTKWKVILSIMLLIATICTVFISIVLKQQDEKIEEIIAGKSESAVLLAETILSTISQGYQKRIIEFSNPNFSKSRKHMIRAFADRDRKQLLRLSKPLLKVLKKEDPYFSSIGWILPDNQVFLRVHAPEKFGENITNLRRDVAAVNNEKQQQSGFNAGIRSIQYRIVQPVFYHDKYLGAVQFGIKASVIFDALREKLNTIAGMAVLNEECSLTTMADMPKFKGKTHTIRARDVSMFKTMQGGLDWHSPQPDIILNNKSHVLINVAAVNNFQNNKLGVYFVALDLSEELAQKRNLLISVLFIGTMLLIFSFLILYFSYGSLVQKIIDLNQSLEKNNLELENRVQERTTKLQENKQRLQKFLDHAPVGILIADIQTMHFQYANPTICTMLGYDRTELNSMNVSSLHKEDDLPRIIDEFRKLAAGIEDTAIDIPFSRKDGTLFEADVISATLELEERPAVIGFIVDRTEMKKLGRQLQRAQKMEAIGMMAGGVAHDLNNILAGIINYPELMLLQLPHSSELREPLLAIQESGKRAATVVADLLTVARGVASPREPHNINRLIDEYLNSPEYNNLKSFHSDVLCTTQLNAKHPTISCSPMHIKKIVMNLTVNAFEAAENKGNVSISTRNRQIEKTEPPAHDMASGNYVVLEIRDDGPGIAEKDLEHIFEPFYTKKVMGKSGPGLGLAVVWNTVQDYNGRIFTKSSKKGTLFQIYFPVTKGKETDQKDNKTTKNSSDNSEHLLVVDDEPQLRDITTKMLKTLGYKVESVRSGELAIAFLKDHSVDLIIMDMLMEPGMSGRQTYEEILTLNPGQKAIIASGFSESDDVKAALILGASKFIKKPYSINTLSRTVKEALNS